MATAFGLGVAIFSLLPFNYLNARLEEARHEIQDAARIRDLAREAPGEWRRGSKSIPGKSPKNLLLDRLRYLIGKARAACLLTS
ncbi:hypothetical protein CfE428DRAFT_0216 [Chthoniobacter flavus Ellin428]|uniref:Uncharacterized protein n=2 Tax=Chthoniobacter flavus TaxID=191863 RepID=B4CU53_9BACT|nr:hypothetical protein CfE428DRAFT_0216 [Chthoniobacter flavus Ellin428]TCO94873.1 hypothetical protein EV701_102345 [Chthoniobacter flavus]